MTLLELAAALAVLVFGLIFLVWDVQTQFRKNNRMIRVWTDRSARFPEDLAWASRNLEYQHAMTITLERAGLASVDAIVAAIERASRPTLDVVA